MIEILSNIKLIFFVVIFIILFIVESYYTKREWLSNRNIRLVFHSMIALINTIIIRVPTVFLVIPSLMLITESNYGLLNTLNLHFFIEGLLGFILLDLAFYWWHRLNHTNSFLWKFHSMHHLDTHLDVTTSLRFHTIELLLSSIYKVLLIFLIGMPISVFIFYEIILSASNQFHHSNIGLPEKTNSLLQSFIVTPKYHTNHHTVVKDSREANYASILTFWDYIFFTYKDSTDDDREYLGLSDRSKEFGIIANLKHPFD
ncbi:MAG: hypothetical protein CMD43_06620 [Gammaproteobacteria bacterium]|nr:hypothetical protein [Gammaproteobacteria bacterium]|tara:strand:+ start:267 stop:1040 length:774 start_codon:yes stop_codon:yes gene_type:complete